MISYKYKVKFTSQFKKSFKKIQKQGKNIQEIMDVINILSKGEELDIKYKNHNLIDDKHFKDCCECHIRPDWLLVYRYNHGKLILFMVDTGSHSDIFR